MMPMEQATQQQEPALIPGKDAPAPAPKRMIAHRRPAIERVHHGG